MEYKRLRQESSYNFIVYIFIFSTNDGGLEQYRTQYAFIRLTMGEFQGNLDSSNIFDK